MGTRRFALTRPFSGTHWIVLAMLLVIWDATFLAHTSTCDKSALYAETVLATATMFIALWTNSLGSSAKPWVQKILRILGGTLYDILSLFLLTLLTIIPILIFLPTYDCVTPRFRSAVLLTEGSALKSEIERRAEAQNGLAGVGTGLTVDIRRKDDVGVVLRDGAIVLANSTAVLILQPSYIEARVVWSCQGYPSRNVPVECRKP